MAVVRPRSSSSPTIVHHVHLTLCSPLSASPNHSFLRRPSHPFDRLAPSKQEWLTNSPVNPTTAPSYLSLSSSTVYTASILVILPSTPAPLPHNVFRVQAPPPPPSTHAHNHVVIQFSKHDYAGPQQAALVRGWQGQQLASLAPSISVQTVNAVAHHPADAVEDDIEDGDSFIYPDAGTLLESRSSTPNTSEEQWLDSLLEELGDDDDEDDYSGIRISATSGDDDEDLLLSPLLSPFSSADDLPGQTSFFPVPYPVPYPPYHPPLIDTYDFTSSLASPLSPLLPYEVPLPYYDSDDVEELSVPDAVEDTSDDESDAPITPSIGHSASSLAFIDPASIPLPAELDLRHQSPHVYLDNPDSYFYPFEVDPLPFPDLDDRVAPRNTFQEC
ncbi:hypothetical protein HGRIS_013223 [Hohenbuehelia grisea]|uniref:Uncharacterized protein n=1 Tax=Hohenbuehelia grisea TaxID=104357 RepID=A0ABR3IUV7_9AGAR